MRNQPHASTPVVILIELLGVLERDAKPFVLAGFLLLQQVAKLPESKPCGDLVYYFLVLFVRLKRGCHTYARPIRRE